MTCSKCRGVGTSIKHPCETCNGSGVARQTAQENITIPPGINTGQNLRMTGKVKQ
jgi:molecular chaperone DnaJ